MAGYEVKSEQVQAMFASIAGRYDAANTALSLGIHHLWRRALLAPVSLKSSDKVLDLCTGTGDLLPTLRRRSESVVGADFCVPMLEHAKVKLAQRGITDVTLVPADAHNLPFTDEMFSLVTVAFGVRNFEKRGVALREIARVLASGGTLAVLEFGQPTNSLFGALYRWYSAKLLPALGGLVTGNREAYAYLERTSRTFPCGEALIQEFRDAGFREVSMRPLWCGLVYCYWAKK